MYTVGSVVSIVLAGFKAWILYISNIDIIRYKIDFYKRLFFSKEGVSGDVVPQVVLLKELGSPVYLHGSRKIQGVDREGIYNCCPVVRWDITHRGNEGFLLFMLMVLRSRESSTDDRGRFGYKFVFETVCETFKMEKHRCEGFILDEELKGEYGWYWKAFLDRVKDEGELYGIGGVVPRGAPTKSRPSIDSGVVVFDNSCKELVRDLEMEGSPWKSGGSMRMVDLL